MKVRRFHFFQILKRIGIGTTTLLFVYLFLLRKKTYSESFTTIVHGIEPKLVWEFVADFTNQQRINPAIFDFEIEYEKGNYENWEYGVLYWEYSLTFPFVKYNNRAILKVLPKPLAGGKLSNQPYRILSDFTTCTLGMCLQTNAEMKFSYGDKGKSTRIMEIVQFDCPPILSILCLRDLRAQKKMVYENIINSIDIMN